jgi:hypothetical protein
MIGALAFAVFEAAEVDVVPTFLLRLVCEVLRI